MIRKNSGYRPDESLNISARVLCFERNDGSQVKYTGVVIENYSDENQAPLEGNGDIQRFRYFGNDLLDMGGEIGFHGYNHMPLVLENFDYKNEFDSYKQWESADDIRASLQELNRFCSLVFPDETFQVYVPPSPSSVVVLGKFRRFLPPPSFISFPDL